MTRYHDGFTLADLVSFNNKHNEANGEDNRDGTDNNLSSNHAVEGADAGSTAICAVRCCAQQTNMLATLLFSQGTPMIVARRRVRHSPSTATTTPYAQDNEIFLDRLGEVSAMAAAR